MSYLVLARKYRPQTFSEVIGQEHVTRTLQNAISRGRIHHAFLFCGGRGTGKTTTARILAKALSCVNAPTAEPCNQCEACVEITRGTSVDVQEIDAASQNRVEDIRELREAIRYAPVRGKKKLYILDEVHMLSSSAFNALLKTLEEPPPHAVFVFATTDPHKLPQTILSRVQRYDFKLVPTARLVDHLADVLGRESIPFERPALQLIAREGAGSVRDSLSLLDQVLASTEGTLTEQQAAAILGVADRALVLELGRAVTARDPEAALQCIDRAYGRGYDLSQLGRALLSHLRDLVVVAVVKEPEALLEATGSELEELRRQAEAARGACELLFSRMVRIADEVSRSPLARYVLEVGVCELCRVEPLMPVGELVDRLELLEGRIDLGGPVGPGGGGSSAGGPGGQGRAPVRPAPAPMRAGPADAPRAAPIEAPRSAPVSAETAPVPAEVGRSAAPAAAQDPGPAAAAERAVPAVDTATAQTGSAPTSSSQAPGSPSTAPESVYHAPESVAPAPQSRSQAPESPSGAPASPGGASPARSQAPEGPHGAPAGPAGASLARSKAPENPAGQSGAAERPASAVPPAAPSSSAPAAPAAPPSAAAPAAPAAPPPSAAAPAAPPGLRPFTDIVKAVIGRTPTLSILASGRPLRWDGDRLQIGFPKLFEFEHAQEKLPQIRRQLAEELGRPAAGEGALHIEIVHTPGAAASSEPDAETLAEAEDRRRSEERQRRRQEALGHPARKQIMEVFGEEVSFLEPVLE